MHREINSSTSSVKLRTSILKISHLRWFLFWAYPLQFGKFWLYLNHIWTTRGSRLGKIYAKVYNFTSFYMYLQNCPQSLQRLAESAPSPKSWVVPGRHIGSGVSWVLRSCLPESNTENPPCRRPCAKWSPSARWNRPSGNHNPPPQPVSAFGWQASGECRGGRGYRMVTFVAPIGPKV